ncbi:MAG TPA: hypothetical protein VN371_10025 [Chlorobaculum sp.]|nr:hypothetical protein [Chlorobaculum sp.]
MPDLGRGNALFLRCKEVWAEYGSMIRHHKLCIARRAASITGQNGIRQVLIPGAGFSMPGIELAATFSNPFVFELDTGRMEEKMLLIKRILFVQNSRPWCLAADVEDMETCRRPLSEAGGRQAEHTSVNRNRQN